MNANNFKLSESFARESFKGNPSSAISFVLTAGYLYHYYNRSFLSDVTFDKMCKWIGENYEELSHPHKHLFSKQDMVNGSLFHLKWDDYPTIVRINAHEWLEQNSGRVE